ncbi:MAG: bifunctional folylpolyglutamate synthase/dihydrofolate synthase [Pseudomonadota bacterium]|nr:bifunctional folylpolyglutamate synthase/dihydrofolate synthase [Pseudomonadota bacterium]
MHDHDPIRASDGVIARLRALHPTLIDLSTGRIERLLEALGRPQDRMGPVIHVAGTNGKGSTTAFLRAIAEAAGLTVNVLTSPHLVRFSERIRIAGRLIDDDELSRRIDEVERANQGQPISFFEIATALAFHAFALAPADLNIVEVGLGGRFDATNVFAAPAVSVITPVDYDHLEMLGPELARIAWEKAGVIKAGRPVVVARQPPEALETIEAEAARLGAPLTLMDRDIEAFEDHGRLRLQLADRLLDLPAPRLIGEHQFANAGLAAAAILALGDPRIDEAAIAAGVASAAWPGRLQRLTAGPLGLAAARRGADLWLDGGHNPHAGRALAATCESLVARDGRPLALIVGMLARKDAAGFLQPFAGLAPQVFTTAFDSESAVPASALAEAARSVGLAVEPADGVKAALDRALDAPGAAPHILVCGSLQFIGDILAMSRETWPT